jgi:hypothetical protein
VKIYNFIDNRINIFLFFLFIILIFLKSPCSLYLGRSENGLDIFYNFAKENSFFKSLFYVYSEAKYYELWTNLSAIVVSNISIPSFIITVYFALIIKLLLLFYIFFSNSSLLVSTLYKFIFASFVIYSTAITPEIWLTVLHSKNYFGLFTFLMLFQNFENFDKKKYYIYRCGLVFSGLSSIYSSILAPAYFYKYIVNKNINNFYNFIYSLFPLIINFFIFIYFSLKPLAINDRFVVELDKISNLIYSIIVRPILGGNLSSILFKNFYFIETKFLIFLLIIVILFFFLLLSYFINKKDNILNIILICLSINIILILLGSQYANFVGGRYAVISSVIFLSILLRLFQIEKKNYLRFFISITVSIALITGLAEFKYFNQWMFLLEC